MRDPNPHWDNHYVCQDCGHIMSHDDLLAHSVGTECVMCQGETRPLVEESGTESSIRCTLTGEADPEDDTVINYSIRYE